MTQRHFNFPEDTTRRLTDGEPLNLPRLSWCIVQRRHVIDTADLIHWLDILRESALSKKKQDVYLGLRDVLTELREVSMQGPAA